jgi:hypothetical protein
MAVSSSVWIITSFALDARRRLALRGKVGGSDVDHIVDGAKIVGLRQRASVRQADGQVLLAGEGNALASGLDEEDARPAPDFLQGPGSALHAVDRDVLDGAFQRHDARFGRRCLWRDENGGGGDGGKQDARGAAGIEEKPDGHWHCHLFAVNS